MAVRSRLGLCTARAGQRARCLTRLFARTHFFCCARVTIWICIPGHAQTQATTQKTNRMRARDRRARESVKWPPRLPPYSPRGPSLPTDAPRPARPDGQTRSDRSARAPVQQGYILLQHHLATRWVHLPSRCLSLPTRRVWHDAVYTTFHFFFLCTRVQVSLPPGLCLLPWMDGRCGV